MVHIEITMWPCFCNKNLVLFCFKLVKTLSNIFFKISNIRRVFPSLESFSIHVLSSVFWDYLRLNGRWFYWQNVLFPEDSNLSLLAYFLCFFLCYLAFYIYYFISSTVNPIIFVLSCLSVSSYLSICFSVSLSLSIFLSVYLFSQHFTHACMLLSSTPLNPQKYILHTRVELLPCFKFTGKMVKIMEFTGKIGKAGKR